MSRTLLRFTSPWIVVPAAVALALACSEGEGGTNPVGSGSGGGTADASAGGKQNTGGSSQTAGNAGTSGAGGSVSTDSGTAGGASGASGAGGGSSGAGGAGGASGGSSSTGGGTWDPLDRGPGPIAFSTKPGAQGLPGTGVASRSPNPESAVYVTNNTGSPHVEGENTVYITPESIGIQSTDDLDAFAILKPVPVSPLYYFSVADQASVSEGSTGTQVRRSSDETEDPGDLFQAVPEPTTGTPGSGANMLWTDEVRIGLQPVTQSGTPLDDVNALEIGVPATPTRVFFSVLKSAQGVANSALADTPAVERGCTVFESALDGTNKVLASCAALGLVADDELDGLIVLGSANPSEILFSVAPGALGASGSPINQEPNANAADIWRSTMNQTHEKKVTEARLGLQTTDDVDALAVDDHPLTPKFEFFDEGDLTPSPYCDNDTGPEIFELIASTHIAEKIGFIVRQRMANNMANVVLYDFDNLQRLTDFDLDVDGLSVTGGLAGVPGPTWSRAAPTADIQFWITTLSGPTTELRRYSGTGGTAQQVVTLPSLLGYPENMIWKPVVDHFAIAMGDRVEFLDRPQSGVTSVAQASRWRHPLPAPCQMAQLFGYDPRTGGLDYAYYLDPERRICQLTNELWFREPPRTWTGGIPADFHRGFFILDKSDVMKDELHALVTKPSTKGCPRKKTRGRCKRKNR